jgi:hypothetical protein
MASLETGARDPESFPRGPTMHAVEGMIIGVFTVAWVYTPLRTVFAPVALLDELLLVPVGALACVNLLLCTLMPSNESPQAAFFGLVLAAFLGYLFVAMEAQGIPPYATAFFGIGFLFQIPAGISLALLGVQALVAAGGVCHRLWLQTQWQETALMLIATLVACLCLRRDHYVGPAIALLVLVLLAFASLCGVPRADPARITVHLFLNSCLALASNVLAFASGSTVLVHLAMTLLLWLLVVYKFLLCSTAMGRLKRRDATGLATEHDPAAVLFGARAVQLRAKNM